MHEVCIFRIQILNNWSTNIQWFVYLTLKTTSLKFNFSSIIKMLLKIRSTYLGWTEIHHPHYPAFSITQTRWQWFRTIKRHLCHSLTTIIVRRYPGRSCHPTGQQHAPRMSWTFKHYAKACIKPCRSKYRMSIGISSIRTRPAWNPGKRAMVDWAPTCSITPLPQSFHPTSDKTSPVHHCGRPHGFSRWQGNGPYLICRIASGLEI